MARPGPQTFAKRQREQAKREKRKAKLEKRALRKAQKEENPEIFAGGRIETVDGLPPIGPEGFPAVSAEEARGPLPTVDTGDEEAV